MVLATWKADDNRVTLSVIDGDHQSSVVVAMYGAHVINWSEKTNGSSSDMIFCSKKAILNGTKAIRGGIPVIFPQFSDFGPLPRHGFARKSNAWEIDSKLSSKSEQDVSSTQVVFTLAPNDTTRAVFNHNFTLTYTVCLSGAKQSTLTCTMGVRNNEQAGSFTFTGALHTYFKVTDIGHTNVGGLHAVKYMDQTEQKQTFSQTTKWCTFDKETDRVYYKAPANLCIVDGKGKRVISLVHDGFDDAVVWNPWDKAKGMSDMDDEEYKEMVCVEAANVGTSVTVAAQETWFGSASYSWQPLSDDVKDYKELETSAL